jgi:hypothetical protein
MFLKVKTSFQMRMEEVEACLYPKKTSKIKNKMEKIMIKSKSEKIGRPRKFGGIIKVSHFSALKFNLLYL